jgi:glutaredoxin 3
MSAINPGRPRVEVFSTTYCGWCRRAEELLARHEVSFVKIDVTGDPEARASLVERAHGRRTVPVVFVDGCAVGGYQELAHLVASGKLDHLKAHRHAA